jgi:hypothetical protein
MKVSQKVVPAVPVAVPAGDLLQLDREQSMPVQRPTTRCRDAAACQASSAARWAATCRACATT